MKKAFRGYQIIYVDSDFLLLYRNFCIYQYVIKNETIRSVCMIPSNGLKNILSRFRLSNRLLRLTPRCCEKLSDCQYVLSLCNKTWVVNISIGTVTAINTERVGFSTPLNLCRCNNKIYWGDYGANPSYESVNIYELNDSLEMKTVYTFQSGAVRHIHNIIFDAELDGFWVLTGDNEKNAGIYKATKDWQTVTPFKTGEQKYRAVVGYPCQGGLIYATDSVEHENFLYYINSQGVESILTTINGSCIYGGETKDYYLFSTTVESPEGGGIKAMLSTRLGGGIKNRNVELLRVDKHTKQISIVTSYIKDCWPMKLLQYGVITIPSGQECDNALWIHPIACRNADGCNIKLKV